MKRYSQRRDLFCIKAYRPFLAGVFIILLGSFAIAGNCDSGPEQAVVIRNVQGIYYAVDINMAKMSHYEAGRQYAKQIRANVPGYEVCIDSFLNFMQKKLGISLETLKARAADISQNIPPEYKEEIRGLQSVFSYTEDKLGDGRLSQNEFLIFQIFGDVGRLSGCSASAVFGNSSSTGKTIVGRNLDWCELPNSELQAIHAVVIIRNGKRSFCSFGFLGDLAFISGVNDHKIFASILDIRTSKPYPSTSAKRSYMMDLRYAIENMATLKDVAAYMTDKDYAYSHLIFLADENSAMVLENDTGSPARGLRSATSALIPGIIWDHPNAIATVNSYLLPGNTSTHTRDIETVRWNSFSTFYKEFLSGSGAMPQRIRINGLFACLPSPLGDSAL